MNNFHWRQSEPLKKKKKSLTAQLLKDILFAARQHEIIVRKIPQNINTAGKNAKTIEDNGAAL